MTSRWIVGVLALAGCLSATQRREDDLIREARMFNDDLRWARWEAMCADMLADDKQAFMSRVDLVGNDLVMGDFEVKAIRFDTESRGATVTVDVEWYRKSDPTVHSSTLTQRWEARDARWIMIKQRRSRGDRFPLVNEPSESKPPAPGEETSPK
jgi:hypothetical protein